MVGEGSCPIEHKCCRRASALWDADLASLLLTTGEAESQYHLISAFVDPGWREVSCVEWTLGSALASHSYSVGSARGIIFHANVL